MNNKPKIFIGSSVESLQIAYAIQENLDRDALCNVWDQGIFELSGNALDNLLQATNNFDFAIFVFKPDDITKIRDVEYKTVRDNLIFELGLFVSKLGKKNVFFLIPRETNKLHLPTDLIGIEPGHFELPENEKDLVAALGAFCNKVRRQIKEVIKSNNYEHAKGATAELKSIIDVDLQEKSEPKIIEYGVSIDNFGNYTISSAPTVFFSRRIAKSFPGIRGLKWFKNPKEATDRLELLLKKPLTFEKSLGYGVTSDPIWWSRGYSDLPITHFERLSETKCLIDSEELEIDKIAVYHSMAYWQCVVYVQVNGEEPIGLYSQTEKNIKDIIQRRGYYDEEYGLYDGIPITRSCYDDGAAVIDGKVTDTSGAKLRVRYIGQYNFIIASKFSPIACNEFEEYSETAFNDILRGKLRFEDMLKFIEKLPRHYKDD